VRTTFHRHDQEARMRWRKTFAIPVALAALAAGLTVSAATQARAATTESLSAAPVQETDAGPARTIDVPGGGYVVAHASGTIAMVGADGKTAWQVGTGSLYKDWDLTWQRPGFTYTPELAWGTDPFNPLEFLGEDSGLINDVNPVAAGELNGNVDVAVAETVGTFITPQSPFFLLTTGLPFNVPGSSLHVGTFVTVLDARTGRPADAERSRPVGLGHHGPRAHARRDRHRPAGGQHRLPQLPNGHGRLDSHR
jgi:hypothetical protein